MFVAPPRLLPVVVCVCVVLAKCKGEVTSHPSLGASLVVVVVVAVAGLSLNGCEALLFFGVLRVCLALRVLVGLVCRQRMLGIPALPNVAAGTFCLTARACVWRAVGRDRRLGF